MLRESGNPLQTAIRGHVLAESLLTGTYRMMGRDEDDDNGGDDGVADDAEGG